MSFRRSRTRREKLAEFFSASYVKMMKHIKFVNDIEKLKYKPPRSKDSFYQICRFKNPSTNLHETRKIIFNEEGEILGNFEKQYTGKIIKQFIKTTQANKFKAYPTYSISDVAYPNKSDMSQAQSALINNNEEKYGFGAPLK
jgi:hypothetical protein